MRRAIGRLRSPVVRRLPRVLFWACVVETMLRLTTVQRVADLLGVEIALLAPTPDAPLRVDTWWLRNTSDAPTWDAVKRVMSVWPFGRHGTCLREALVSARLLRHRHPAVMLGAASGPSRAVAHAWIVIDGRVLDPEAVRYTPLRRVGA